jgi:hypothetical protein
MNLLKFAAISSLISVFFMVSGYPGATDRTSMQKIPARNTPNLVQMHQPDSTPSKSEQTSCPEKHGRYGVTCVVCHGSIAPTTSPQSEKCSQCHNDFLKNAALSKAIPNPHMSHVDEPLCGKCHKEHRHSVLFCNKCHVFEMKVP